MRHISNIIMFIGVLVFGAGFSSILGYISGDIVLYKWYGSVGMAINTSVAFILTGLAIFLIGKKMAYDEITGQD